MMREQGEEAKENAKATFKEHQSNDDGKSRKGLKQRERGGTRKVKEEQ